jgi:hypothetical protein
LIRGNSKFINPTAFAMRKFYMTSSEKEHGVRGLLREKVTSSAANPMANPSGMLDMMKGNMGSSLLTYISNPPVAFMIPNFLMMGLISYFFAGFVLVKVPFSLTLRFKSMLQRGIELNTLDASYVSSLSWYFLVMFGMRGFLSLLLGEQAANDDAKNMQMGMGAGPGMGFDASKAFKQERDSLLLHQHEYALENIEYKVLGEDIPPAAIQQAVPLRTPHSSKYKRPKQ